MKYFHSLIITGVLIPFLSLSAESAHEEAFDVEFADEMEEASLISLEEELSLIDEEFEEFKEELYSLENDLQNHEESSSSIPESLFKSEIAQQEDLAFEEENDDLDAFDPEMDDQEQMAMETEPSADSQDQSVAASFDESMLEESEIQDDLSEELADAFIDSEVPEPVSELVMDDFDFSSEELSLEEDSLTADSMEKYADSSGDLNVEEANELQATRQTAFPEDKLSKDKPSAVAIQGASLSPEPVLSNNDEIVVDMKQAFAGSPIIYSLLFAMSVFAVGIWLYSILALRSSARVSHTLITNLHNKLNSNNFEEALSLCEGRNSLFCKMVSSGIYSRRHGLPIMIEAMKAEGKRATISFWQKIGLLNDIAIIAPMLGLLGTVLGMFYAFYDINRSIESISTLFDGLGISVGTTVAGLVVAILALILHSTAKYRLVRALALVENQAQSVATLIDDRTSIYKGL